MISVCMIVKNEEKLLHRALNSIKEADEIIICDTGSKDSTVKIAKQFTDKVYEDFKWCDDFASARNHAKSKATQDWILTIDADEYLEENGIKKIKDAINSTKCRTINCNLLSENGRENFYNSRIHKNDPDIYWVGKIHENLNIKTTEKCDVKIIYGYSPAHQNDPDRSLRILKNVVESDPNCVREKYYLAREYWYRKDYLNTIKTLDSYIDKSNYVAERADAHLMKSRCLWNLSRGDEAREECMKAIINNSNFKEAVLFMAEMSWEHNAKTWKKFAEHCTNENVLFVRS